MRYGDYDFRAMTARAIVLALIPQTPSIFDSEIAKRAVELTDMLIYELDAAKKRNDQEKLESLVNKHQDEVDERHPAVNGMLRVTRYDGQGKTVKVGNCYPCKFVCQTAPNGNRYHIGEKITIFGVNKKTVITLKPSFCDWEEVK